MFSTFQKTFINYEVYFQNDSQRQLSKYKFTQVDFGFWECYTFILYFDINFQKFFSFQVCQNITMKFDKNLSL